MSQSALRLGIAGSITGSIAIFFIALYIIAQYSTDENSTFVVGYVALLTVCVLFDHRMLLRGRILDRVLQQVKSETDDISCPAKLNSNIPCTFTVAQLMIPLVQSAAKLQVIVDETYAFVTRFRFRLLIQLTLNIFACLALLKLSQIQGPPSDPTLSMLRFFGSYVSVIGQLAFLLSPYIYIAERNSVLIGEHRGMRLRRDS